MAKEFIQDYLEKGKLAIKQAKRKLMINGYIKFCRSNAQFIVLDNLKRFVLL